MKRLVLLSAALILAIATGIGAQANKPALVIRANVEGADVTLNGIPLGKTSPHFAILLDPGTYSLKVAKAGYSEFSTLITLPAESLIVNVSLVAMAPPPPSGGPSPAPAPPSGGPTSTQSGNYAVVRNGLGETMRALARGPSQFVAVGNSMVALDSADGKHWSSPQKIPGSGNFVSVRWVKDRFLAPGDYGLLYSSSDGQAWKRQSTNSTRHLGPAAWMAGRFFVVGQSGTMLASSNGTSWSQLAISYSNNFLNIAAEKSTLVVTGSQGLILYSTDGGVVWNKAASGVTDNLFGLASGPAGFVAGGSSQRAPLLFSPDGKSWSVVYRSDSSQTYGAIIWDGARFLVAASYGEVLESRDGREWRKLPAIPNGKHAVGVATDGTTIVIAQSDGTIVAFPREAPAGGPSSGGAPSSGGGPSSGGPSPTPPSPPSTVAMKSVTLLKEDFENKGPLGALPPGWLRRDNKNPSYPYAWEGNQDGRNSRSGDWSAMMTFGTAKAMITPPLQLAEGGTATLAFWAKNRDPKVRTNLTILLSHGGSNQGDFRWELGRIRGVPDAYQRFSFDIGPEHGGETIRVMFLGDEPEEGQVIHVDDVEIVARVPDSPGTAQALKPFVLIDENFEGKAPPGVLPPGWMSRDNRNPQYPYAWDCAIDNRNAHSGIQFTMASGTDKGLITPAFNVPSGGATVSFWLRNRDPKNGGNLDVLLSYGGTEQRDFTDTLGRIRGAPDTYQLFTYEIGGLYAGRTVRVMFYAAEPQQGQIMQIDDVVVEGKR